VLSAAVFVFVGVDSNHFRYVQDVEVTVQGLVNVELLNVKLVVNTVNNSRIKMCWDVMPSGLVHSYQHCA